MGHALAVVGVTASLFALGVWLGWWIFLSPADPYDWRDGPAFSMRNPRDLSVMALGVITIVVGGVLYLAYRAAVFICS